MGAHTLTLVAAGSLAGAFVGLVVAAIAWNNRERPAATQFALLMVAVAGWCVFAAAQMVATTTAEAYLFDRIVRVSSTHVPPLALTFVLAYGGHDEWLAPKWLALLWAYPVIYILLSVTAPLHGLATGPAAVTFQTVAGVTAPVVPVGPAKTVHLAFAYVVMVLVYLVLFRLLRRTRTAHRGQAAAVVVGSVAPFFANVAFYTGFLSHPGLDPTPMTFVLSGGIIGWGLFRHNFLSVTPLASDVLIAGLPDPVLVLDRDDRVVDSNPAAAAALVGDDVEGEYVSDVAPGLIRSLTEEGIYSVPTEHATDGGVTRFYDPQVETIDDQHDTERGRLVVLRDVTGQHRRQDRLEALQAATQRFIAASTDEEIASLAVDFLEQALDHHGAGVFLVDDAETTLQPAALTDTTAGYYDDKDLTIGPDSVPFDAFESGEQRTLTVDDGSPFTVFTFFPLGDHGVVAIGSREEFGFASDDEQFAAILARTTQVALSQVEREGALRQSRASVERRSEQIEFFNGVLRHTMRNALLVIQGRADHLRAHVEPSQESHIDVIERWCEDLATLSDEIRALNDTVTATESERFEAVDLTALLRSRTERVALEFESVDVTVDVGDDLQVRANELAGRVLDTVIRNAVDHNDATEPRVEISTQLAADRVQVRVADNGSGMSDEMKESVFERALATNQTASGFGLYFVSVVMNLYGGTVWFEDNDPRGTVAVLEFQSTAAE
ncbi:Signal transduction histidine kinase [Halomicrobium zhouii]|uniref:Signal transduction histidine kinase n=1 Tax=Halomicrobium zhouii TaxID=767519 RepID=A0A1I6KR06_9EURY|nr:histidine kinase N-terminal 7TM domain-containing protein [Halomicrobium zhouii]SFR93627.1 Signal transduction histidine kinase [Halomicrobium zhouii]